MPESGMGASPSTPLGSSASMRCSSAALAAERRSQRRGEPELYEVTAFQEKVADGYRQAMTLRPQDRVELVDGAGDVDTVHRAICAVIEARLPSMVNKEMTDA